MLQRGRDLVLELVAVDRSAAAASAGWVAGLDHEVGDDAVDQEVVIVASLSEGLEILACLEQRGQRGRYNSRNGEIIYLWRMLAIELYDNCALLNQLWTIAMREGLTWAYHCGFQSYVRRHAGGLLRGSGFKHWIKQRRSTSRSKNQSYCLQINILIS